MEFKKYIPSIEVNDNGTTKVQILGGTIIKGSAHNETHTSGHYWKFKSGSTKYYVRNACRVLINNKPVTDWIFSSNYLVGTFITRMHNNNNH